MAPAGLAGRRGFETRDNLEVAGGSCNALSELPPEALSLVHGARRAVLSTLDRSGGPHAVPVCFAVVRDELVTAIDHKPKAGGRPARLANVERNPVAAMLFDRWDEDWRRLGWVLARGAARVEAPGTGVPKLVARYPQYERRPPAGEVIVLSPRKITWWLWERPSSGAI